MTLDFCWWSTTLCLEAMRLLSLSSAFHTEVSWQATETVYRLQMSSLYLCGHSSPSVMYSNLYPVCYNTPSFKKSVTYASLPSIWGSQSLEIYSSRLSQCNENSKTLPADVFVFRCQSLSAKTLWKFVNNHKHRAMWTARVRCRSHQSSWLETKKNISAEKHAHRHFVLSNRISYNT
jgi:hypothetical protein